METTLLGDELGRLGGALAGWVATFLLSTEAVGLGAPSLTYLLCWPFQARQGRWPDLPVGCRFLMTVTCLGR